MNNNFKKVCFTIVAFTLISINFFTNYNVYSETQGYGVGVSPMKQNLVLNAGDTYSGSFMISNGASNDEDFEYSISVTPFYVNEEYTPIYTDIGSSNQIVDWIYLDDSEGIISPNQTKTINYIIKVPINAPAGGQYAAIKTTSKNMPTDDEDNTKTGIKINQKISVAYLIFAEIAGETVKGGEIIDASVPSFMLSGNINGSSSIMNTGNVHGIAKYTLQVFPLFSDEEIFTNEENPNTKIVLPDRSLYNETTWDNTPIMGIFNVIYTVEFEGAIAQVSKLVIKCPIWLLFIIIFVIAVIIIYIIAKARKHRIKRETA